jgi:hypothetical protein
VSGLGRKFGGMENKEKKYLVKVSKDLWDTFREVNRKKGYGVSVNQRMNFWIANPKEIGDLLYSYGYNGSNIKLKKPVHSFILTVYDSIQYSKFKKMCAENNLSMNKVFTLLMQEFILRGEVCSVKGFKA